MVAMAEALETYPVECSGCYEPMIEALETDPWNAMVAMTEALKTYPVECNGCYG